MSSSEDESLDFPVGIWSDVGNKINNMTVFSGDTPHGSEGAKKIEREAAWRLYKYIQKKATIKNKRYSEQVDLVAEWLKDDWEYDRVEVWASVGSYLEMINKLSFNSSNELWKLDIINKLSEDNLSGKESILSLVRSHTSGKGLMKKSSLGASKNSKKQKKKQKKTKKKKPKKTKKKKTN